MAFRIGDYVTAGELRNTHRNGVFGWIEFAPDYGIRIELTGNFSDSLAGKFIRFKVRREPLFEPGMFPDAIENLADRQIGVVGDVTLRRVKVPDLPIDDFLEMDKEERKKHLHEKDCLHLEWFSQNGRVVAELVEPTIEFVDEDEGRSANAADFDPIDEQGGMGFAEIHIDENGVARSEQYGYDTDEEDDEDEEDPYGLFDDDLEQSVADSLGTTTTPDSDSQDAPPKEERQRRPWDEVIPNIDPETKAMYEQWDEIFDGEKDEPISYLFQSTLKLPKVENVTSDEEAEPLVKAILAQLALLSVALDVCEHYSPLETYRLLMQEILPTAKVHPNLAASDMVQHYSTSDYCPTCESEMDAEYEDMDSDQEDLDDDDDSPFA